MRRCLPDASGRLRAKPDGGLGRERPGRELATAIERAPPVLLPFAFVQDPAQANALAAPDWIAASAYRLHTQKPADPSEAAFAPHGLIVPARCPGRAAAATATSPCSSRRTVPCAPTCRPSPIGDDVYPSLAVEAARLQLGVPREQVVADGGAGIRLGPHTVPVDGSGRQLINHYGPEGYAADLLRCAISCMGASTRLPDRAGSSCSAPRRPAPATSSPRPFGRACPAASIWPRAIDNILSDRSLRRGDIGARGSTDC